MSNGSSHSLAIVPEAAYGVTPANPQFQILRHVSTTLALSKETLESGELRSDRQTSDLRHGAHQVGGDLGIELSYGTYDSLLEALMCGTWSADAATEGVAITAADGSFSRDAGSFVTDGYAVGQALTASGFAAAGNNGRFAVVGVSALDLDVAPLDGQVMSAEADAAAAVLTVRSQVGIGTTRRSFTAERRFGDIPEAGKPYHRFTGVEVSALDLQISANAMVTGTFTLMGQGLALAGLPLAGATYDAPTTTSPLDSFTGSIVEGGQEIGIITEVQLKAENGQEARFVVGSKQTLQPSIARGKVTGQVTAYFEDSTMLEKFINETTSGIEFSLPDPDGGTYWFYMPRVKYTGGQPDVAGEGPITLSMPFQALRHADLGATLVVERQPAA